MSKSRLFCTAPRCMAASERESSFRIETSPHKSGYIYIDYKHEEV